MQAERVSMRRVHEILRYRFEQGLGHKAISVRETPRLAASVGLAWPLDDELPLRSAPSRPHRD